MRQQTDHKTDAVAQTSSDPSSNRQCPLQEAHSRRSLLSAFAGGILCVAGGCLGSAGQRPASTTRTVDLTDGGLSRGERTTFRTRVRSEYGDAAVARLTPSGSSETQVRQPGMEPTAMIGDATERLTETDRSGGQLAVADNYVALYETATTREDGVRYGVYWMWTAVRTTASDATVRRTLNHVELGGETELTVYSPDASEETAQGPVRADPEKTGQAEDQFGLAWKGKNSESVVVTGFCIEKRTGAPPPFDWHLSVTVDR